MQQHFDEQPPLGDFYSLGLRCSPSWATGFLELKYQRSSGYRLLGYLRDLAKKAQRGEISVEESYKTKPQLAELAFPQEMVAIKSVPEFERLGNQVINRRRIFEKHFIDRTGAALRAVAQDIREKLKACRNDQERFLLLREKIELFVRVGLTDNEGFRYAYHGVEVRQSPELLRINWELMQLHAQKQDAERRVAEMLYVAETRPIQTELPLKLNPNFTPGDELDIPDYDIQ